MNLPSQNEKEVVFENVIPPQDFTLENQERTITDVEDIDIEECLEDMFVSQEQFVILTAPETQYKVRYIQACMQGEDVDVELGVEEEGTRLFYKICTKEECYRIFLDFFDKTFKPDMDEYKPLEF